MVWYLGGRGLLMRSFYRTGASPDLCNKAFIERKFFIIILEIYINSLKKMACIIMHANWFDMLDVRVVKI